MAERVLATTKTPESEQRCSEFCKQNPSFNSSGSSADRILQLQRTAGNQAVQRLINSGVLQAKLRISQPNDIHEQEADKVAEQVMKMPELIMQRQQLYVTPLIQRQVPEEKEETLQSKEIVGQSSTVTPSIESSINALRGGGQPLDPVTRVYFEPRFGYDFSQVRVHTDAKAAEVAQAVNARAFTVGKDVVFGTEQYSPGSTEGRRLLGHELTHVVQQVGGIQRQFAIRQLESEQETVADNASASISDRQKFGNYKTLSLTSPSPDLASIPDISNASMFHGTMRKNAPTKEIIFEPEEAIVPGPDIESIRKFLKKLDTYLALFRQSRFEAIERFNVQVFHAAPEQADPKVLEAVLSKVWEMTRNIIKKQIVEKVSKIIPHFDSILELVETAEAEFERAAKASEEVNIVQFIDANIQFNERIQSMQNAIANKGDDLTELLSEGMTAKDSRELASIELNPPSQNEILKDLVETYIRESEQLDELRTGALLGTGILYLKYEVDEKELRSKLIEAKLSSPYAAQFKEMLRKTFGTKIRTKHLNMTRVIRLERKDLDYFVDQRIVSPGEERPHENGRLKYYEKVLNNEMPEIEIDKIHTTTEPVYVGKNLT